MSAALVLLAQAGAAMPQGMPGNVGSGMISGGWNYVWAAYGIFWAGLVLYTLSLFVRSRSLKKEQV